MAREINSSKTALQQTFYKILWQITPRNEDIRLAGANIP